MKLTTVKEIYKNREQYLDKEVTVGGWVRSVRDSKTFGFIVLHDGSFFETLQVVYHDSMDNFQDISKLNVGAAIIVKGNLVATPQAKQPFEIQAEEIMVEGESAGDYPLQKKRHSLEYLRTISHLRPRTNTFQAVFRVRSLIAYAIHQFFQERGFVYVHTPLITGSDCEGAGEMFRVTTLDMENLPKTEDGMSIEYYFKNIQKYAYVDLDFYLIEDVGEDKLSMLGVSREIAIGQDRTTGEYNTGKPGRRPDWITYGDFRWKLTLKKLDEVLEYISAHPKAADSMARMSVV